MNAEQSNATQAVNDCVVLEKSSAKQRREERMKKFDIELETMMRLEQALFVRRRLELQNQMKELETKYQLIEEWRESRAQSEENSIREWCCSFPIN